MKLVITQMQLEHRLSALLQLHLHSRLNTWLTWIGQLQDETRNIKVLGFGAPYIRGSTVSQKWIKWQIGTRQQAIIWTDDGLVY